VPLTVNVRLLFAGRLLITALMLLPVFNEPAGQTAPPVAVPQVTLTLVKVLGTASTKIVPLATLGPSFDTTMV
jgi:hypothetical protein